MQELQQRPLNYSETDKFAPVLANSMSLVACKKGTWLPCVSCLNSPDVEGVKQALRVAVGYGSATAGAVPDSGHDTGRRALNFVRVAKVITDKSL